MTNIFVLSAIDATCAGPLAEGPDGDEQPVHLAQGDLDGAHRVAAFPAFSNLDQRTYATVKVQMEHGIAIWDEAEQ